MASSPSGPDTALRTKHRESRAPPTTRNALYSCPCTSACCARIRPRPFPQATDHFAMSTRREFVIGLMADGWTEADILANYPGISRDDILACLAYARDSLSVERVHP